MAHLGTERSQARDRFFWPGMKTDIHHYINRVCRCLKQKKPNLPTRESQQSITIPQPPFELVSIDFVHLKRSSEGRSTSSFNHHFTRYTQAYPTRNKSAHAPTWENLQQLHPGFRLHSSLPSWPMWWIRKQTVLEARATLCYCPLTHDPLPSRWRTHCQVERINRSLLHMLRTLLEIYKSNWK